ncbi:MAG: GNAT family N-acetyltransferase [Chloroflexi bacterium HGW-Chloroflexi-5]|jgi:N-acetylglutamate synthase-like GNAT family acetyltransferase|nr:MAG: GNAT family N-acetyltransferase [Chloroflexi bacterium HGW-Chloroflexi-5]
MKLINNITILPFQPADQAEVKQFVLAGLVEHWGFLNSTLNPDLNDIEASYADGLFLVALQDGRIAGTGALLPRSEYSAEIMRMSVPPQLRRSGLGHAILQRLCEEAKAMGFQKIILETTETWQGVIAFYLNFGFHITHQQDGDVYFALELIV